MKKINLKDLPATKKTLQHFSKCVFTPIFNGNSNIIFSVPNWGCNSFIKYILAFPKQIHTGLQSKLKQHTWIHIEAAGISGIDNFWKKIALAFTPKNKVHNHKKYALECINKQIAENKQIVFIMNSFDDILLHESPVKKEVFSLASINTALIKCIPIIYAEITQEQRNDLLSKLRCHNFTYIPMRNDEDMKMLLEKEERWYSYKIPQKVKARITDLAGGYSSLARGLLLLANEDYKKFLTYSNRGLAEHPLISIWLIRVYNALSDASKTFLKQYVISKKAIRNTISPFLQKTEILTITNKEKKFFTPLFEQFLKNIVTEKGTFTMEKKKLTYVGIPVKEIFSKQEYIVFKTLWKHKNKSTNREDIAQAMWRKDWKEKYSDWAIDKVISKIRKKIGDTDHTVIRTAKGKGFVLQV